MNYCVILPPKNGDVIVAVVVLLSLLQREKEACMSVVLPSKKGNDVVAVLLLLIWLLYQQLVSRNCHVVLAS